MPNDTTSNIPTSGTKSGRTAPPPTERIPVLKWIRENLVSSPLNTVVTIICVFGLIYTVPDFISWVF